MIETTEMLNTHFNYNTSDSAFYTIQITMRITAAWGFEVTLPLARMLRPVLLHAVRRKHSVFS
jgi:hypothetical protein